MRIRGIKFICDRCGKEKFYELDDHGEFKEPCKFYHTDIINDKWLCEECENERNELFENFMRGKNK